MLRLRFGILPWDSSRGIAHICPKSPQAGGIWNVQLPEDLLLHTDSARYSLNPASALTMGEGTIGEWRCGRRVS